MMIDVPIIMSDSTKEADEVKAKVRSWLEEENLLGNDHTDNKLLWAFVCKFNNGWPFMVYQGIDDKDKIAASTELKLHERDQKKLRALRAPQREDFLLNLQLALLETKCGFTLTPNREKLEKIGFQKIMFYDGLSKQNLMDGLFSIFNCILMVTWRFRQAFGSQASDKEQDHLMPYG